MQRRGLFISWISCFASLLIGTIISASTPCLIRVQPGEAIQKAINAAPEGAVICLAAGEWEESITIYRPITLRGQGNQATRVVSATHGVIVRSSGVILEDVAIASGGHGVWVTSGGDARIVNVRAASSLGGTEAGDTGVRVEAGAKVSIHGSDLSHNGWGIVSYGEVHVEDSTITHNTFFGLGAWDTATVHVANCSFLRNGQGILISGNARATIEDTSISHSVGYGSSHGGGIVVEEQARATIIGCTVEGGDWGVLLFGESQAEVKNCRISGNKYVGIQVADSVQAVLLHNQVIDNGAFGISLRQQESGAAFPPAPFFGSIEGSGNHLDGNGQGPVWPYEQLGFLVGQTLGGLSPEGGVLGQLPLFPDPGLERAVRAAIGKPDGEPLKVSDLTRITYLCVNGLNVDDLEGIQHCTGLTWLSLSDNTIRDITRLSFLPRIETLWLSNNQIRCIQPLASLHGLTILGLSGNSIQDLTPLARLEHLETLWLNSNQIQDIRPLASLSRLATLGLNGNRMEDIDGLLLLPSLSGVYLRWNALDLTDGSKAAQAIGRLQERGVSVQY